MHLRREEEQGADIHANIQKTKAGKAEGPTAVQ
jgi:hypothetical protein